MGAVNRTIMRRPLSWGQLQALTSYGSRDSKLQRVNGPTNSHANLRLFGQSESDVRLTLFRDKHAWCPYCQKVWMWLEEKAVPYQIQKVTMFCYGEKDKWYKRKVPSGMLPAVELDGEIITESDEILFRIEEAFGPLYRSINDAEVVPLRRLERGLFAAWCQWLCYPARSSAEERQNKEQFKQVVQVVEEALGQTAGPFFLKEFSIADIIFLPYMERMNASLFYCKGYLLRDPQANPAISAWFDSLEKRSTYLGTQSDFHTHCHDLPPQMGGCYENEQQQQQQMKSLVNHGPWFGLPDANFDEPEESKEEALYRVIKHKVNIIQANPNSDKDSVDEALRCALTAMMTGEDVPPPSNTAGSLRYIRDRVNVPRDMPIYSARHLRSALERIATLQGNTQGAAIPTRHRRDQDPVLFGR